MNIGIIGAGISGLSIGQLLKDRYQVTILEKEEEIGGIAKTKIVNGVTYHPVGGHCFNSKNKEVLDFIFNNILPKEKWHLIKRDSKIYFKKHYISYPIEFSVKEIFKFNKQLAFNIVYDFFNSEFENPDNLEDWFKQKFGNMLANEYFIPYNKKIWKADLKKMIPLWVKDKLPIPDKMSFFKSLISQQKDSMPHSVFYYPNTNNMSSFIEALAKDLKIITSYEVRSIKRESGHFLINGEKRFDILINTSPLDGLPFLINNCPENVIDAASKLRYNKVTTTLWKSKNVNDRTWTYFPDEDIIFHRNIHIGNFFVPKKNYTITESIGAYSFEETVKSAKKIDYLIEPIDFNISEHAYVVFDSNYERSVSIIKQFLDRIGLYTLGRFGEWDYYNMDISIEKAMELSKKLLFRNLK